MATFQWKNLTGTTTTFQWSNYPSALTMNTGYSLTIRPFVAPQRMSVEERKMPVIGYRAWQVRYDEPRLLSLGVSNAWEVGVNTARCMGSASCKVSYGRVPDERHDCGFYAILDPKLLPIEHYYSAYIAGAVMGWGRVVQHVEGWRAEHVRILALSASGVLEYEDPYCPYGPVEEYAKFYGVPVLSPDALQHYVREFGD